MNTEKTPEVSFRIYWQMFITFIRIGAFTIGGGYAMIPLIQREVVQVRKWINPKEFIDMLALAQSAPGVISALQGALNGEMPAPAQIAPVSI